MAFLHLVLSLTCVTRLNEGWMVVKVQGGWLYKGATAECLPYTIDFPYLHRLDVTRCHCQNTLHKLEKKILMYSGKSSDLFQGKRSFIVYLLFSNWETACCGLFL